MKNGAERCKRWQAMSQFTIANNVGGSLVGAWRSVARVRVDFPEGQPEAWQGS